MNNISLIGRLTKDVDLRQSLTTGKSVAKFTIAVRRDNEHTDFIPCVAFDKTADVLAKYTSKGSQIGVDGRLQSGKYDNNEGKTIFTLDVFVNRVELLGSRNDQQSQQQPQQNQYQQPQSYQQPSYQQPQMNQSYQPQNNYQQPQYHQMSRNDYNPNYAFEGFGERQTLDISSDDLPF